ncbi:methyltransferase domain-containing protein [Kordiimonas sp.]|uniref:methyltransferase domain-containing protein n=1 Tax=Kordiimonas sp. TaxID=1970157 RepID=UPI003A918CBA
MTTASQQPESTYTTDFYQAQVEGSLQSAQIVIPHVLELVGDVASVLDVGCGTGAWLSVFKGYGVDTILGVDGGSVPEEHFLIERDEFLAHSLTDPLALGRKFSLAMSLEVAEHLEDEYAEQFVALLCAASDLVLFGAAIPGQGGHNHVNERWPSYWKAHFEAAGYVMLDIIRPAIWTDERVEWWYRQNTFLFVKTSRKDLVEKLSPPSGASFPVDIVHPDCFVMFHDAKNRAVREQKQYTLEWLVHSVNEDHKKLCDLWLDQLLNAGVKSVALFCAGGNGGLGPYLILRCRDLGISVVAYIEHMDGCRLDLPVEVPILDKKNLSGLKGKAEMLLIASPAFAGQIIDNIEQTLGDAAPPLCGQRREAE